MINFKSKTRRKLDLARSMAPWDVVNIGTSISFFAFDYRGTGVNGMNLGYCSQFLYYTEKMLYSFIDSYKEGTKILIVLPEVVFCKEGKGIYYSDTYYEYLKKEYIDDFNIVKYIIKNYPIFNPKSWIRLITNKILYRRKQKIDNRTIEQKVHDIVAPWAKVAGVKDLTQVNFPQKTKDEFAKSVEILKRMLIWCQQKQLKPILIVPPLSLNLKKKIGDTFIEKVLFENIAKANVCNAPVLDYYHNASFDDLSLYNGVFLLNEKGRKLFTKQVLNDIKKI